MTYLIVAAPLATLFVILLVGFTWKHFDDVQGGN